MAACQLHSMRCAISSVMYWSVWSQWWK